MRLYADAARRAPPVWGDRPPPGAGCADIGLGAQAAPGGDAVFATRFVPAESLAAVLRPGRYYLAVTLREAGRGAPRVVPAGALTLGR